MSVVLLLIGSSTAACSQGDDPGAAPEAKPTPITAFDADGMTIARTDFCDRIPEIAVERAVGEVEETDHYGNGESAAVTGSVKDVSHEFNCTFTGTSGAVARVWVFVPQVTRAQAGELVKEAGRREECRRVPGEGFGKPSTGLSCRTKDGAEASYRGLFVDSWLACSVSSPDRSAAGKELLELAGSWCVQAVSAAATE
ncbi:hypothetical protein ncot_04690 [Nocardioides sp. JQ2195]|uniref:hypothetical protein n=1 Tax=Nocardioides sp. JQ2195 TaxID=2592334 RepID=UPI00143EB231|nr:hypothetical protein [Nocardioides sp. JQ2195]QIX25976.1 hypothetical protein ncot_04690 [Nocardioides sp. JQ2195]